MKRLEELINAQKQAQKELQRLANNIELLRQKFDIEFGHEPDDENEGIDYIPCNLQVDKNKMSAIEKTDFEMAITFLSVDQLFILLNALEDAEQFDYCAAIKQRILDVRAAENARKAKVNRRLTDMFDDLFGGLNPNA